MPTHWRCPACSTIILHAELDTAPRGGERYRCHLCRVELQLDNNTQCLMVPQLEPRTANGGHKPRQPKSKASH